jgi:RNA polymerase sigma-70 factor (ECF subfamily)
MMPEIGSLPDYIWEEPDKSGTADQIILYKELITEIKKLPPSYRVVFNMYVIDGYSHHEIAEMLDISTGTSKSSLSKARMHLQKYLNRNSTEADICKM